MTFFKKILGLFERDEKIGLALLFVSMAMGAAAETIGLGLVIPYIGLISDPSWSEKSRVLKWFTELNLFSSRQQFLLGFGLFIALFYVGKNTYLGLLNYSQNVFLFNKQAKLSKKILQIYLDQPYSFHLQRNSSELIINVNLISNVVQGVLTPLFAIIIESLVTAFIITALIAMSPGMAIFVSVSLGLVTFLFYQTFRKKLRNLGQEKHRLESLMHKWILQGLNGIKEVKVLGRESFFVDSYMASASEFVKSARFSASMSGLPRLLLEPVGVCGLVLLVSITIWNNSGDTAKTLPTLALLTLALNRLLPSLSKIVGHMTVMRHCSGEVDSLLEELSRLTDPKLVKHSDLKPASNARPESIELKKEIELRNISFRYEGTDRDVLQNVSMSIKKGQSVGFVGPSGAGKSTLVDLILGLLKADSGTIEVDGRDIQSNIGAWQRSVGYIPQSIYLIDDSIRRNVAFGVLDKDINDESVWKALRASQLEEYVRSLPEGLDTKVGERGVRMSGGQRQRVGIARALYHDPVLLVLDEATSALDADTEREVTKAIESLAGERTLIVIAHRLSTIKKCNHVYKVEKGIVSAHSIADA